MTILAFDCCLANLSVAVVTATHTTVRHEHVDGGQAEALLPLIIDVMAEARVAFDQITQIAVTLGPGGFTSVRVGIAAARGLALALGIPAVGQSSLWALYEAAAAAPLAHDIDRIVVVVPAGRGGVYRQTFSRDGTAVAPADVVEAAAFADMRLTRTDLLIGPAAEAVATQNPTAQWTAELFPRADILAHSAKHLTRSGELRPIYLRAADARPHTGSALVRADAG